VLAVIQVPEHGLGVLAARSAEGSIRGHGDRVHVAGVADVVGLKLAVGQVPDLSTGSEEKHCSIFIGVTQVST
jgi:hypothetical protein